MAASILKDILKKGAQKGILPAKEEESRNWFRDKAKRVRNLDQRSLMQSGIVRGRVMPGFMYMFSYDPKLKDTLPYYDRFPLVFPFGKVEGGFMGLNLHYLPRNYRAVLMDALYDEEYLSDTDFNAKTKLVINYQILNSTSKLEYFKPCVKTYLYSHVKSRYILVPSNEWDIALFLPTENFAKASKEKVQRDSVRKIG